MSNLPKSTTDLDYLGLKNNGNVMWNPTPPELYEEAIRNGEATLTNDYALRVLTGSYTGRSPNDKFIVDEPSITKDIDWGEINQPISPKIFNNLHQKMVKYLDDKRLYVKDCYAGADEKYRLNVRIVSEVAYHALFSHNMLIQPSEKELKTYEPEFTVLAAPNFKANPKISGVNSGTFIIVSFEKKLILIGGTLYSGEVKKGIFGVMNYILPQQEVLPMHCSANMDEDGNTAIFFGLSGTGKTTLSSDPRRILIGDDEHGWSENGIFNIEGGCYAKTINLSQANEPLIYGTTKRAGTILENVALDANREPDFTDVSLTKNTRCSYPIYYIPTASKTSRGNHPSNVIFLTCDAFGVLPPISKLTSGQAIYHFLNGYTAKVAGTERGIAEPQATFSACFGAPFMPLRPPVYADLLAKKIQEHNANVWLINTGWTGGPYEEGHRIKLAHTRTMLNEVLAGNLSDVDYTKDAFFGLSIPVEVESIPGDILDPVHTWKDKQKYYKKAEQLALMFKANFQKFSKDIRDKFDQA